jgi:signal transduction histidine kinase
VEHPAVGDQLGSLKSRHGKTPWLCDPLVPDLSGEVDACLPWPAVRTRPVEQVVAPLSSDDGKAIIARMRALRIAPWVVVAATAGSLVWALWLDSMATGHETPAWKIAVWSVATFASSGVGLVLATRRGSNPVGWLLLANGLVLAAMGTADSVARYAVLAHPGALPGAAWAVLVNERAWPLLFVFVTAIAWVFPDGRLPSPRWRPYAIAAAASYTVLIVLSFLAAERFSDDYAHVSSPLPEVSESILGIPLLISGVGALAALVGGALAVRTRLRRSSGVEHQQVKWLAFAAVLIPAAVVVCLVEIAITGEDGPGTGIAVVVALTAIPAAVGIAVMRYRLYEIDRLINRTLVYVGLSASLAAVFAAVSLSLGVAIGSGSTLSTAAATLAVALLFGPLRKRVQLLVDRRFDRARYEGLRTVERFLADLWEGRAAPEAIEAVLAQALGDPGLQLLFRLPAGEVDVDATGRVVHGAGGEDRARTPVRRGTIPLATVVHDPALGERPDLLESVIGAAGLAIEIARLGVEARRQLAEVEESRARIVTAGYEERRRLERDLHDGAQQRLVSIGLALRHAQGQLPAQSAAARTLDSTVDELARAIAELRELARGVRPAGLDDGLARALGDLVSRSRLRTTVEVTGERFEDKLETAAYFVASEALANAAKHAGASHVVLRAERQNGTLVVSVDDDGVGGAVPSEGSGLSGITDRVAALGGRVTVVSPPGRGTVVTAELPCES